MGNFGQTLFGGSRFVRFALTPFVLVFALLMPFAIERRTPAAIAVIIIIEFMSVALLAGFWLPSRFGRRAFRALAGLVFITYLAYLIYAFFVAQIPFRVIHNFSEDSSFDALLGFIIIGLPSLWYFLYGRFTRRPPNEDAG